MHPPVIIIPIYTSNFSLIAYFIYTLIFFYRIPFYAFIPVIQFFIFSPTLYIRFLFLHFIITMQGSKAITERIMCRCRIPIVTVICCTGCKLLPLPILSILIPFPIYGCELSHNIYTSDRFYFYSCRF